MDSAFELIQFSESSWSFKVDDDDIDKWISTLDVILRNKSNQLISEWVLGDACFLLFVTRKTSRAELARLFYQSPHVDNHNITPVVHHIPIQFTGEDLEEVTIKSQMSEKDYIQKFLAAEYSVKFMGFTPGFAYIEGGFVSDLPRRSSPRTHIAAGAVAVAAGYTCIYPSQSAGGWNVIAYTDIKIFDEKKETPFLFSPGDKIKFNNLLEEEE